MNKILQLAIFTISSLIVVVISLLLAKRNIKKEKSKNLLFIIVAIITVFIHFSSILYELITNSPIEILDTYYLPVYPCNIIMWQNLIIAILLILNKKGKLFTIFANGSFFIGTLCAFIGMAFNINFLNNPSFLDFDITKGLLSHVTLLFCCLYLVVGKYIAIKGLANFTSIIIQGVIFALCGVYSNVIEKLVYNKEINSMYLQSPPFEEFPFLNGYTIVVLGLIIYGLLFFIIERKNKTLHCPNNNAILKGENK